MFETQTEPPIELHQLIQNCLKGDRQSQSKLYSLFAPKMFLICQRYCRNREEAEEILQEGFVKVFSYIHQFKFAGSFEGWVRKIMVNCALQKFRSKPQLHIVTHAATEALEHPVNEEIISRLGTKELLNMVQQLPPGYRIVFNLYVFEGMKHREIAKALGITEGTSKSNLSDARIILQKAIATSLIINQEKINCL
ncbi:MAG: RNA polymerase sigma factor [Flavisolibacter sp.]